MFHLIKLIKWVTVSLKVNNACTGVDQGEGAGDAHPPPFLPEMNPLCN